MDALRRLNDLPAEAARAELLRCCGSLRWASAMTARRPYPDVAALHAAAEDVWWALGDGDWREAVAKAVRIERPSEGWPNPDNRAPERGRKPSKRAKKS
jgi:2-oxo-4-hydroxy-4-carboxy-5-ureidoimidazoline decarboxylase